MLFQQFLCEFTYLRIPRNLSLKRSIRWKDIYITANIIYLVQELYLGDNIGQLLAAREVNCRHTLP